MCLRFALALVVATTTGALAFDTAGDDGHLYLAPKTFPTTEHYVLYWIHGAKVDPKEYVPLLEAVQEASGLTLWVGLPHFLIDMPEPGLLDHNIERTHQLMQTKGKMPDVDNARVFYGAHSLGTVWLQKWCYGRRKDLKKRCSGLVLTGGFLSREYYKYGDFNVAFDSDTLTIGGSLDGLARVTRTVAESYHQLVDRYSKSPHKQRDFSVVAIEGMNHHQWHAGEPSFLEKMRDIRADISDEEARSKGSALIADWLAQRTGVPGAGTVLDKAVESTRVFVKPIIDAYLLEGSRHFDSPVQVDGPLANRCKRGACKDHCDWTRHAQEIIAGDLGDDWHLEVSNQFADASSTPLSGGAFHLPEISNDTATKTVTVTTYSQSEWALGDRLDTGFVPTSAKEIASKMASRQCLLVKGVGKTGVDFSVDDPDFCQMANKDAYDLALSRADARTAKRFAEHGQRFTFGPDEPKGAGPLFLMSGVSYKDEGDAGVLVSSPMLKTSIDYWVKFRPDWVPDPGCYHYCKLLSPARAAEWIYVDGLRRGLSLEAPQDATADEPISIADVAATDDRCAAPDADAKADRCCATCPAGTAKYISVDTMWNACAETCMDEDKAGWVKWFEKGLKLAEPGAGCAEEQAIRGKGTYSRFKQTAVHGVPLLKKQLNVTIDMFGSTDTTRPARRALLNVLERIHDFDKKAKDNLGKCPDLAALADPTVDRAALEGEWDVQAYVDIAQVGARCQSMDVHKPEPGGAFAADFRAEYKAFLGLDVPFSITQVFVPRAEGPVYDKHAVVPLGSVLNLPTVVVSASSETLVLFSCLDIGIGHVPELIVATNSKSDAASAEARAKEAVKNALAKGVPVDPASVKYVDRSEC